MLLVFSSRGLPSLSDEAVDLLVLSATFTKKMKALKAPRSRAAGAGILLYSPSGKRRVATAVSSI